MITSTRFEGSLLLVELIFSLMQWMFVDVNTCFFAHLLSFALLLLYLPSHCEKIKRQNPVFAELQFLKLLLPGGKNLKLIFGHFWLAPSSVANTGTLVVHYWLLWIYGFYANINRMNFGVLVFAELKTIAGSHNFAPAEPKIFRVKYLEMQTLAHICFRWNNE